MSEFKNDDSSLSARGCPYGPRAKAEEMATRDPVVWIAADLSEIVLRLAPLQPKLHKRLTNRIKQQQLDYILGVTKTIYSS